MMNDNDDDGCCNNEQQVEVDNNNPKIIYAKSMLMEWKDIDGCPI